MKENEGIFLEMKEIFWPKRPIFLPKTQFFISFIFKNKNEGNEVSFILKKKMKEMKEDADLC